ncbi:MAG: sugar ABC transporter permease YjfF [Caldilineae bacterium]|nr:sugar ABC transporter permease YjfF [Anaerolineae bacterium]MCB9153920.1 sugar ABC transporter permease YjfF [Caldilineae bacterium]
MSRSFKIDRKYVPMLATICLFVAGYVIGAIQYPGMARPQTFFNLFIDNAFLLIASTGLTLVILSGGIDLSVGAVIALTSVAAAYLMEHTGLSSLIVIPLMLLMGAAFGALMGGIIHVFKVQPFIVTLAGMFFARGMAFFISLDAITITDPFYRTLSLARIHLIGKSFVSVHVIIAFVVLAVFMYLAHLTHFGRTVYAMGGNEQSARLMGLAVGRTKVLVYTLGGFCSALAGLVFSNNLLSGHGLYANGLEMEAIAAVIIGGTLLTGGVGYVFGTMFGVLVNGLIQVLIIFNGELSSWWTRIVIGLLTLVFILVQSTFASMRRRQASIKPARKRPAAASDGLAAPDTPPS